MGPRRSNDTDAVVYSSGAITTKEDTEFNITYANDWDKTKLDALFSNTPGYATTNAAGEITNDYEIPEANQPGDYSQYGSAYKLSNLLEQKYYLVKWNLGHYNMNSTDANEVIRANSEIQYIDELVEDADYGEASITPINKFINIIDWRFARYGNVSWEFIFTVFKTKITLFGNF